MVMHMLCIRFVCLKKYNIHVVLSLDLFDSNISEMVVLKVKLVMSDVLFIMYLVQFLL